MELNPTDSARFAEAIRRFDAENSRDPNMELADGQPHPRELIYAQWLTDWVLKLSPNASEPLRLAARCQHICRWVIPRSSYPLDKPGYLRWRADLKKFHADRSGKILREVGYDDVLDGREAGGAALPEGIIRGLRGGRGDGEQRGGGHQRGATKRFTAATGVGGGRHGV